MKWLRENAAVVSIGGSLVLAISGIGVARYQLSGLVDGQAAVQSHIHDSTRHLDPVRDAEKLKSLENRVDQLERQLRWMERRQGGERRGDWQDRRRER